MRRSTADLDDSFDSHDCAENFKLDSFDEGAVIGELQNCVAFNGGSGMGIVSLPTLKTTPFAKVSR